MEEKITAWVTRNGNNNVIIWKNKPIKINGDWIAKGFNTFVLGNSSFPQVKLEDKEPTKVELTIKICK